MDERTLEQLAAMRAKADARALGSVEWEDIGSRVSAEAKRDIAAGVCDVVCAYRMANPDAVFAVLDAVVYDISGAEPVKVSDTTAGVVARAAALDAREAALNAHEAKLDARGAALDDRSSALDLREADLAEREAALAP